MGADDAPTVWGAHPGLGLAALLAGAQEFGVGGGEVRAVGGDDGVLEGAGEVEGRSPLAELGDRPIAIEIFGGSIANSVGAIPKQSIER